MNLTHNHQTTCADALKQLRMSKATEQQFQAYFNDGLTPSQAISSHESKLMVRICVIIHYIIRVICYICELIINKDKKYRLQKSTENVLIGAALFG